MLTIITWLMSIVFKSTCEGYKSLSPSSSIRGNLISKLHVGVVGGLFKHNFRSDPSFLSLPGSSLDELLLETIEEEIKKTHEKLLRIDEMLDTAERVEDVSRIDKLESRRDKLESLLLKLYEKNVYLLRQQAATAITVPHWTVQLDIQTLFKPKEVPIPVEENAPPYYSEKWLQDTVNSIEGYFHTHDTPQVRVPPMALVRCHRGGKTRALYELSRVLKERLRGDDVAVIYISLKDKTPLMDWESLHPIDAICRRIAYAALVPTRTDEERQEFARFTEEVEVSSSAIVQWLGDSPRILLIDELNQLEGMNHHHPGNVEMENLAAFLKKHFLTNDKQYFVFSSPDISSLNPLSEFMESRDMVIRELPLIDNFRMAVGLYRCMLVDPKDLLHYGCIPGLVYESVLEMQDATMYGNLRKNRDVAIENCIQDGWSEELIEQLLGSFLDGNPDSVPPALLQLMDTTSDGKVRWIPCNMIPVLRELAAKGPRKYSYLLSTICDCFKLFVVLKSVSWENLFLTTLLIRCVSHRFDKVFLPLNEDSYRDCSVSFNVFIGLLDSEVTLWNNTKVDNLIRTITVPNHFPHIAVYEPQHFYFETFDVIVAVYDRSGKRTLYGYQLKERRFRKKQLSPSRNEWIREKWFETIYAVRGQAGSSSAAEVSLSWRIPNEEEMDTFFGVGGHQWTPRRWAELDADLGPTPTSKRGRPKKD